MAYSIPALSINPDFITMYDRWYDCATGRGRSEASKRNLKNNKRTNDISPNAAKRLNRAVSWLCQLSDVKKVYSKKLNKKFTFRCSFVTLTLPASQCHSDNIIKSKLLNSFLNHARLYWGVKAYVWRAEKQKNGNIHFHIMWDKFVIYWLIRKVWNRCCEQLGYITLFAARCPGRTPNSTDVHSVRNVKDIRKYIGKYMTKQGEGVTVDGRTWGLSQSLSRLKNIVIDCVDDISTEFNYLCERMQDKVSKSDYFCTLLCRFDDWRSFQAQKLKSVFDNFVLSVKKSFVSDVGLLVVD
jgi:hypothetical protein